MQIRGVHRKVFTAGPAATAWSRIRPTRRRFRKESKSGSERNRWSFQSLPVPAIPIRVAKSQKIQQSRARAQRKIQPRPPTVSFWDPTSCPQLALGADCGHQSAFSFDRERPFSFRRNRKENGGSFPCRKAAHPSSPPAGGKTPSRARGAKSTSPPCGRTLPVYSIGKFSSQDCNISIDFLSV